MRVLAPEYYNFFSKKIKDLQFEIRIGDLIFSFAESHAVN